MPKPQIYHGTLHERNNQAQKVWRERNREKQHQAVRRCKWKARRRNGVTPRDKISLELDAVRLESEIKRLRAAFDAECEKQKKAHRRAQKLANEFQEMQQRLAETKEILSKKEKSNAISQAV